jgi:hypothetical protein
VDSSLSAELFLYARTIDQIRDHLFKGFKFFTTWTKKKKRILKKQPLISIFFHVKFSLSFMDFFLHFFTLLPKPFHLETWDGTLKFEEEI